MSPFLEALAARLEQYSPASLVPPGMPLREAAVLVPLRLGEEGLEVVFTRRPENLRRHAGQISFPGGGRDSTDETPLQTALREAEEELGIPAENVRILGQLDETPTNTGFRIQPFVGVLTPACVFIPHTDEVAEVIVVPWSHLLDGSNHRIEKKTIWGREIDTHRFEWRTHVIWGATAFILHNLLTVASELPTPNRELPHS